jgi:Bax protein
MRAKGQILDGKRLAATLYRYSERGSAYVDELDSIIDGNDLEQLDNARLTDAHGVDPVI